MHTHKERLETASNVQRDYFYDTPVTGR